ncbi:hypothetical protein F5883DRAFT_561511 [Diaporthe sp. PMI_573]|nr:hypothetical protein F5883DRAFT_561511 [Diaporthaceae sp. PMI_573]
MALHFYSSVDFRNTLAELYSHNGAIGVIQRLLFAFLFGCFMSTLNYTVPGLLMSRREVTSMMKKKCWWFIGELIVLILGADVSRMPEGNRERGQESFTTSTELLGFIYCNLLAR